MPAYMAWLTRRQSTLWDPEQELTFSDAGITISGYALSGLTRWEGIMRVAETSRFILFFTSDQGGYFIPKAALPDEASARDLVALLRARAGKPSVGTASLPETSAFSTDAKVVSTYDVDTPELPSAAMVVSRRSGVLRPWYVLMVMLVCWTTGPTVYRQWQQGGWSSVDVTTVLRRVSLGSAPARGGDRGVLSLPALRHPGGLHTSADARPG
jgi:hypothetical protein